MDQNSNLVCGYTTQDHLLVDLDKCNYWRAKRLTAMVLREWPDVGPALVVRSSPAHYHLVFDSRLTWERIILIIQTLAALGIVQKEYATVRTFRRDLTLRVSPKSGVDRYRPAPEPVRLMRANGQGPSLYGILRYLRLLSIFNRSALDTPLDVRKST